MSRLFCIFICLVLTACSSGPYRGYDGKRTASPKKATSRPYKIKGIRYYPQQHYEYRAEGVASHYGDHDGFHGKKTATGEVFDADAMTAAHKTLPLPCVARITNLENGRSVVLKINDRGPFIKGRVLDVSRKAAKVLGFYKKGLARVRIETDVSRSVALNRMPLRQQWKKTYYAQTRQPFLAAPPQIPKKSEKNGILPGGGTPRPSRPPIFVYNNRIIPAEPVAWQGNTLASAYAPITPRPTTVPRAVYGGAAVPLRSPVFVQAGRFVRYDNARSLSHHLKQTLNLPAQVQTLAQQNLQFYDVQLGPFHTRQQAHALMSRLKTLGYKGVRFVQP